MTANKKAKKITGDKAAPEKYTSGGWAKADDPIYSRGWTIAPNMSGRLYKKESPSSEDTFTKSPQSSTLEDDITDPTFLSGLSKTHLGTTLEPRPSNAFKVGGRRLARLPQSSSKTRHRIKTERSYEENPKANTGYKENNWSTSRYGETFTQSANINGRPSLRAAYDDVVPAIGPQRKDSRSGLVRAKCLRNYRQG